MDKITLKELASRVNLSAHHFCRTFKQITGKTTIDFINGIRLDKAIYYLKETDLNMTEIAMRCGFDSINYFSRLFKRIIIYLQLSIEMNIEKLVMLF